MQLPAVVCPTLLLHHRGWLLGNDIPNLITSDVWSLYIYCASGLFN